MLQDFQVLIINEGIAIDRMIKNFKQLNCTTAELSELKERAFSYHLIIFSDSLTQKDKNYLAHIKNNRKFNTPLILYLKEEATGQELFPSKFTYDIKLNEKDSGKQIKELITKFRSAHSILKNNKLPSLQSNLIDSKYFNFFYKIQFKIGWRNLLLNLFKIRVQIVDMIRLSAIYQNEPETESFFRECCEKLIDYCHKCGAHKLRKFIRINLYLMEMGEYRKLQSIQVNFRHALNETDAELNKIIRQINPHLTE